MIDDDHTARMEEINTNHKNAMVSIQTQSELETAKHNSMMTRIREQRKIIEQTGRLDINQISSTKLFISNFFILEFDVHI